VGAEVFISHSSVDARAADQIRDALEAAGITCWISSRDIPVGVEWAASIADAIEQVQLVLLLLSARANASEHVQKEIKLAGLAKTQVIPVKLEPVDLQGVLKYHLIGAQEFDASRPPLEDRMPRLIRELTIVLNSAAPGHVPRQPSESVTEIVAELDATRVHPTAPTDVAPSPPKSSRARGWGVAVGALVALLVVAAVAVLIALAPWDDRGTDAGGDVGTTVSTPPEPPPAQTEALKVAAVQLESLLVDARTGFTNLNQNILQPFNACQMSGEDAATRMQEVISNRQNIVNSLNALRSTNPTAQTLISSMRHAMQLSLDSDYPYQAWLRANPGVTCPRLATPDKARADELGRQATPAKQAFADQFNPVAEPFGLEADWNAQF
jgi:hypothetical protein